MSRRLAVLCAAALLLSCADPSSVQRAGTRPAAQAALMGAANGTRCPGCVIDQTFVRAKGAPVAESIAFAGDPRADYVVDIDDQGSQGANATVVFNGTELVTPDSVAGKAPFHLHRGLTVGTDDTLTVRLTGKPGSTLRVRIIGGARIVPSSGGTVTAPGGAVALTIPAGALSGPTEIVVAPAVAPAVPDTSSVAPRGPALVLEPEGQVFATPVTLIVHAPQVATGDRPALFQLDPVHGTLTWHPSTYDANAQTVTASLTHFSEWVVASVKPYPAGAYSYFARFDPAVASPGITAATFQKAVGQAFLAWQAALRNSRTFVPAASADAADIVVDWEDLGPASDDGAFQVLCWTTPTDGGCPGGEAQRGAFLNLAFAGYRTAPDFELAAQRLTALQTTVTHLLGHVLGLPHDNAAICDPADGTDASGIFSCYAPPVMARFSVPAGALALGCTDLTDLAGLFGSDVPLGNCASRITAMSATSVTTGADGAVAAGDLPVVRVRDAASHPVAGVNVVFLRGDGSIAWDTVTNANGDARLPSWTLPSSPGTAQTILVSFRTSQVARPSGDPRLWTATAMRTGFQKSAQFTATVPITGPNPGPGAIAVAVNNFQFALGHGVFPSISDVAGQGFYQGTQVLFAGGLVVGTSASNVLVGYDTRGYLPPGFTQTTPIQVVPAAQAVADQQTVTTLCPNPDQIAQGYAASPGLAVVQESFAWAHAPDNDYALLRYTFVNTGATDMTNFFAGLVMDWDIPYVSSDRSLLDAGGQLALVYPVMTTSQTPSTSPGPFAGVALPTPFTTYYPYSIRDPDSPAAWYGVLSGGIRAEMSAPADARHYVGVGPITLAAGASASYVFALVGGASFTALQTHAASATTKAGTLPAFQGQPAACP